MTEKTTDLRRCVEVCDDTTGEGLFHVAVAEANDHVTVEELLLLRTISIPGHRGSVHILLLDLLVIFDTAAVATVRGNSAFHPVSAMPLLYAAATVALRIPAAAMQGDGHFKNRPLFVEYPSSVRPRCHGRHSSLVVYHLFIIAAIFATVVGNTCYKIINDPPALRSFILMPLLVVIATVLEFASAFLLLPPLS